MAKLSAYLTIFCTFLLTACGAKSTGDNAASVATSATPAQALVAAASQSTIVPGSTVTFSVIGGTAPYTWTIASGGGTLSSNTGASVIYTASNNDGIAFLTVTDSTGNTANASVTVSSGGTTNPTAGNVCMGNYTATLGTYPAAFQFATNGTALTGNLYYAGYTYALTGTCTATAISFTLTLTGDTFQGTFAANPTAAARAPMMGTYNNVYYGSTQNWTATPQ